MCRILLGGFSHITSHRFSTSHLFSVSEQIARLPNTKDAHANRLSDALIGVADVVSAAGLRCLRLDNSQSELHAGYSK